MTVVCIVTFAIGIAVLEVKFKNQKSVDEKKTTEYFGVCSTYYVFVQIVCMSFYITVYNFNQGHIAVKFKLQFGYNTIDKTIQFNSNKVKYNMDVKRDN